MTEYETVDLNGLLHPILVGHSNYSFIRSIYMDTTNIKLSVHGQQKTVDM